MSATARSRVRFPVVCLLAAAAFLALGSCASAPKTVPPTLSPAEYFQNAQDAAERGDFPLALRYYQSFQQKFPDDVEHGVWASYEIAFLYHKMGDDKKCIALLDELLARYAKGGELPDAPRILAQKVKAQLEAEAERLRGQVPSGQQPAAPAAPAPEPAPATPAPVEPAPAPTEPAPVPAPAPAPAP